MRYLFSDEAENPNFYKKKPQSKRPPRKKANDDEAAKRKKRQNEKKVKKPKRKRDPILLTPAIERLLKRIQTDFNPMDFEANRRGYFNKLTTNWYRHVPFFVRLQQYCRARNRERCLMINKQMDEDEKNQPAEVAAAKAKLQAEAAAKIHKTITQNKSKSKSICRPIAEYVPRKRLPGVKYTWVRCAPNLTVYQVIPEARFGHIYIQIDKRGLFEILKRLKNPKEPEMKKNNGSNKRWEQPFNGNKELWDRMWRKYFGISKIERHSAGLTFANRIQTDGNAFVFLMNKEKKTKKKNDATDAETKERLQNILRHCDREVSFDVGDREIIAGQIIDREKDDTGAVKVKSVRNFKISSKQYHWMTKLPQFKKQRDRLVGTLEDDRADDRERIERECENHVQPSSRTIDFKTYADHTLRFFNRAMDVYGSEAYVLTNFLHWIEIHRTIGELVRMIVAQGHGKHTFVFVGKAPFTHANSPCKGYVRTSVRLLFKALEQHPQCTVRYVDEYRTTKLCSRCFNVLENGSRNGRKTTKSRFKVCRQCKPSPEALPDGGSFIYSHKNSKKLKKQKKYRPRYSNEDGRQPKVELKRFNMVDGMLVPAAENAAIVKRPRTHLRRRRLDVIAWKYIRNDDDIGDTTKVRSVTLNRDTNAGRNIRLRGHYELFGIKLPDAFTVDAETQNQHAERRFKQFDENKRKKQQKYQTSKNSNEAEYDSDQSWWSSSSEEDAIDLSNSELSDNSDDSNDSGSGSDDDGEN
ncbi:uncharacterized protein LOC116347355 [Contarinia nasturtii]|uniref:uncharacterized protein LOC116347355 n=1 Tax=Contarinia nasturtii TaxID=265458 RepID=UPI0012D3AD42|nr:uncharacterized protein LOC116347355 [Contarinia nasturtii]